MRLPALALLVAAALAGCGDDTSTTTTPTGDMFRGLPYDLGVETDGPPVPAPSHVVFATQGGEGSSVLATLPLDGSGAPHRVTMLPEAPHVLHCSNRQCVGIDGSGVSVVVDVEQAPTPVRVELAGTVDAVPVPKSTRVYAAKTPADAAHTVAVFDYTRPTDAPTYLPVPQATADTDGGPDPTTLYRCGQFVYVALADLVSNAPSGPSRIAVFDTSMSDKMVGVVQLEGHWARRIAPDGPGCDPVLVATQDGVERVNLAFMQSMGLVKLAAKPSLIVGGDALAFVVTADGNIDALDVTSGMAPTIYAGGDATDLALSADRRTLGAVAGGGGLLLGPADGSMLTQKIGGLDAVAVSFY